MSARDWSTTARSRRSARTLDAFIRTLDVPDTARAAWPAAEQQAFWINGYNALVLRTVINAYPIQGQRGRRIRPTAFDRFRAPSSAFSMRSPERR